MTNAIRMSMAPGTVSLEFSGAAAPPHVAPMALLSSTTTTPPRPALLQIAEVGSMQSDGSRCSSSSVLSTSVSALVAASSGEPSSATDGTQSGP